MLSSRLHEPRSGGIYLRCRVAVRPQSRGYQLDGPKGSELENAFITSSAPRTRIHYEPSLGLILGAPGTTTRVHLTLEGVFTAEQSDGWTELEVELIDRREPQVIGADFIRKRELRLCINHSLEQMRYEMNCKALPRPRLCEK